MLLGMLLTEDETTNRKKLHRLYEKYKKKLYGIAYSILKDNSRAEDMVHDTYLSIIDRITDIDENNQLKTWNYLATIVKHKSYNTLKKDARYFLNGSLETEEQPGTISNNVESEIVNKETANYLALQLEQLTYPYKEVLLLKYYNEMDSKTIGGLLGLSPANVRQMQRRALKKIRQRMKGAFYE